MTAERKPSEIADELERLVATRVNAKSDEELADARYDRAIWLMKNCDAILAALRSAAPPRGEPVAYPKAAVEALMGYQQADEDGVMVLASRQAIHEVFDYVQALRSAAPPRGVPREPTEQMIVAGAARMDASVYEGAGRGGIATDVWRTMYDAAPSAGRDAEDAPTPDGNSTK